VSFCSLSPQKKEPLVSLNRMLGRHWIRSEVCGLEHNKRLLPEIEKRTFVLLHRSVFCILTELHRLPLMKVNNWGTLIQKWCKSKYFALAPVVCCALSRLFRSTFTREWRLQHQSKFPGIAVHGDVTGYVECVTKWLNLLVKFCALLLNLGQHITDIHI